MKLKGKNALVTGVSRKRGIGAAIAKAFAREGANVVVSYYRPADEATGLGQADSDEPAQLLDALTHLGAEAHAVELDLSYPDAAEKLMREACSRLGTIDILVNNAAYSVNAYLSELTADLIDKHYRVNVRAMLMLCKAFVEQTTKGGRIINLTSGQGLHPMEDNLPYAATKGAVEAFTLSVSSDIIKKGVTVNAIDPGATDTGWMTDELKADLVNAAPTGRVSTPEDAARLAVFLASGEARWVTGQVIRSRGGS